MFSALRSESSGLAVGVTARQREIVDECSLIGDRTRGDDHAVLFDRNARRHCRDAVAKADEGQSL
jgi:hypothetical protein